MEKLTNAVIKIWPPSEQGAALALCLVHKADW